MNSDSTPPSETNLGRTPPPNVIVPSGHIYITVGDIPKAFTHGVLMKLLQIIQSRWHVSKTESRAGLGALC